MFSIQHIIWVVITVIIICLSLIYLKKKKPALKDVLTACCVVCVASEVIKVLSCIEMIPSSDGSIIYPYLQMQHLPLHLYSLPFLWMSTQIIAYSPAPDKGFPAVTLRGVLPCGVCFSGEY